MRTLLKISAQPNNETPLVVNLEKTQTKEQETFNSKTEQKLQSTPKGFLMPSIIFQQPLHKGTGLPVIESKPSLFNQNLCSVIPKVPMQPSRIPLIDPKIIAQEKANNERELEQRNKPENEVKRQILESPNYSAYIGQQIEESETPLMRAISGGESITRQMDFPISGRQESAFTMFNPTEEIGLMRFCSGSGLSFGRSPTSQREFGRVVSQSEDRDESPFEERMNYPPLSSFLSRSYFTSTGYTNERDHESKHNY